MSYSISQIKAFIRLEVKKAVSEELLKYGFTGENERKSFERIYVPMKVLVKELKITKTTIHNWRNNKNTNAFIEPYIKKSGRNVGYDLAGIKELIRKNPTTFSKGKNYNYRDEVMSDVERKMRIVSTLHSKINDKELTDEEIDLLVEFDDSDVYDEDDNVSVENFDK